MLAKLEARASGSGDAALARALAGAPEVVQGVSAYGSGEAHDYLEQREVAEAELRPRMLTRFPGPSGRSFFEVPLDRSIAERFVSAQVPLPRLLPAGQPLGHFNVLRDDDGVVRFTPPFVQLEHPPGLLPSLELQTAATALGATIEPVWDPGLGQLVGARLRRDGQPLRTMPLSLKRPRARIDYPGPAEVFRTVSLADVLERKLPADALRGKVLLVGVTLVGQYDQVVTPFRNLEAGIYAHAAMLSSILSGRFLQRGTGAVLAELVFLLGVGLLLGLVLPRTSPWLKAAVPLALALGWMAGGAARAPARRGAGHGAPAGQRVPLRLRGGLRRLPLDRPGEEPAPAHLPHYVAESVMDQMLDHPEQLRLGGEKRELTVLFSDIRGFTALVGAHGPRGAGEVHQRLPHSHDPHRLEEGGTLDKYIGDALMAFWGAPVRPGGPRAARLPDRAAASSRSWRSSEGGWRERGAARRFDIGVGINSGPMVVGNMGSDLRFDYTVMGDAVNLASRLEGANKEYETSIIVSEATWKRVANARSPAAGSARCG